MLVEEYRGKVLENTHSGRICVVDENGRVIYGTGDVNALTYYRSASKPFQLLPLIMRALNKKYGLTDEEMTVCSASHAGEEMHIRTLESLMFKTCLREDDMIMLPAWPANEEYRDFLKRTDGEKRRIYHNCSGKHLALMLLQRELTGNVSGYWKIESPAQQEVLGVVADISDFPSKQTICGLDGCGVPVFAVPLKGIAAAYMKLANPTAAGNENLTAALTYISNCIKKHPYLIRGHGYLCSEINTLDNIVAKGGAEGVYGFGLKRERIGVSFKISDGSESTWPIIIAEILRQLGYEDDAVYTLLGKLKSTVKVNDNGKEIGSYHASFKLNRF